MKNSLKNHVLKYSSTAMKRKSWGVLMCLIENNCKG